MLVRFRPRAPETALLRRLPCCSAIRKDTARARACIRGGGVADLLPESDFTTQELIAAADRTLHQAKRLGRNRMVSMQAET